MEKFFQPAAEIANRAGYELLSTFLDGSDQKVDWSLTTLSALPSGRRTYVSLRR